MCSTVVRRNALTSSSTSSCAFLGTLWLSRLVELRQVAQEQPFAALEAVAAHVVVEAGVGLEHVAADRLGVDVVAAHPGMDAPEAVEHLVHELGLGLGPGHLLEPRDPLLPGQALRLELRHQLVLGDVHLPVEDRHRVLEHRLGERHHVERVVGRGGVEPLDGLDQEERELLVQREVELEVLVDHHPPVVGLGVLDHRPARRCGRASARAPPRCRAAPSCAPGSRASARSARAARRSWGGRGRRAGRPAGAATAPSSSTSGTAT